VKFNTVRFGEIEVGEDKVITMTEGLLGFPSLTRFIILDHAPDSPFHYFQAVDDPEVTFIIIDPLCFKPDYKVAIAASELADLKLEKAEDAVVCAIVTVPDDPNEMTANLQGPLIINAEKRLARQVVLYEGPYTTKHKIFGAVPAQPQEAEKLSAA